MSTTIAPVLDLSGTAAIPFGHLFMMELPKSADTRAGRWLTGSMIASAVLIGLVCNPLFAAIQAQAPSWTFAWPARPAS